MYTTYSQMVQKKKPHVVIQRVCASDKANGVKMGKHEFFVLFLFLQLFYKVEIISKQF